MEVIVATWRFDQPGGSETYALTIAEHLARFGHSVTIFARQVGMMATLAEQAAIRTSASYAELPDDADAVIIGVHRALAIELATKYPRAVRLFVVHGIDDLQLPPPVPGVATASVAMSDRHLLAARAAEGGGEVVRLRQPVDLRRFSTRGKPRERPAKVLLLGNYHDSAVGRAAALREAWGEAALEWQAAGGQRQSLTVAEAIADSDIVVGYGRSVLEAMACGRPAYVYDHCGADGWVTPESYGPLERAGFAAAGLRRPPDAATLRRDLDDYRAHWGQGGHDLARANHDAREHVAELVSLIERFGEGRRVHASSAMRALSQLAESQLRAELNAEHYRIGSKHWFSRSRELQVTLAEEREARQTTEAELHRQVELVSGKLEEFKRTRRYRLAQRLGRPLDVLRAYRRP